MKLLTTVIGSYPAKPKEGDVDPFLHAIKIAVDDQLEAGIDLISDGQTRYDMIRYFTLHLPGFEVKGEKSYIINRILPSEEPFLINDIKWVKSYVGERAKVKGILTGPITLVFSTSIGKTSPYSGYRDEKLYMDVAEALAVEAERLEKAGVDAIQIDEPMYSVTPFPTDLAKKAVERIALSVKVPVALHVCGNIKKIFNTLLDFEGVSILSHAFAAYPENFEVVSRARLEDHGKKLGIGCVRTDVNRVEDFEHILRILRKAVVKLGIENIVVHPDCGLRILDREVAKEKLKLMVKAARQIAEEEL